MKTAWTTILLVGFATVALAQEAKPANQSDPESPRDSAQTIDPTSVNASCYVCHMMFVREPISRVHFAEEITCIQCHGVSAAHANDEHIGATKPDVTYRRDQVDAMCGKCHKGHDVPARELIARFLSRKPKGWPVVCTDCHGHHRIAPPELPDGTSLPPADRGPK